MNASTARLALDVLDLPPGGTVAVTGAAGAAGGYAVEPARADGLTMIADAAPRDVETVRGFGADHVVERGAGIAERIRALVPEGVAGVVDGSAQTADPVPAISDGGTLVELRGWPGPAERDIRVCPVMVPDRIGDTAGPDTLCRQAEAGVLTPRVAQVLPAAVRGDEGQQIAPRGATGTRRDEVRVRPLTQPSGNVTAFPPDHCRDAARRKL
ncbi:hypothetical protein [Streptomyces sp. NPDC088258]|uniref:hypothetical protein n=1 Tax=Streptomyces sp. NPDC088258 TaxID=3365849 RepID=UPI003807F613